ncbi:ATP-binding protein [Methylomagnum ishizawai]|uniref:ATP-binding protein n=1 Tax=Methylomagnum ishizawai TaxID=1760988 RepID=UPI001C34098A|nr:ATP-binding protein [Methylomagnum ishizawai]BBL75520.1 two-component sensor histidine kinase [Methylomagnum ishizawai]
MGYSLQARALLFASLALAAFLGLTGLVLDEAFGDSAEAVMRDRLRGYGEPLKASIEKDHLDALKTLPQTLNDRFVQPGSGLYATLVRQTDQKREWLSDSAQNLDIPWPPLPGYWTARLDPIQLANGTQLHVLSLRVDYATAKNRAPIAHILQVAETLDDKESYYYGRMNQVRRDLWRWFGGAALLLLLLQALILRRCFAPLRRVAADIRRIEAGRAERLTGFYPRELHGLTGNLNALLDQAESHLARYRDALGDLAHSLKTPLAVLRGSFDAPQEDAKTVALEQIERMNRIVEYQLKRAAAAGRSPLAPPVPVADKARQLVAALNKVYADKGVVCESRIDPGLMFRGDEGDLLEILGNLTENAYKWARNRVALGARHGEDGLEITVEDDGPGIPPAVAERLLKRGERADPAVPGHGLGLAIVHSIVKTYGGRLELGRSPLGGAAIAVKALG